MNKKQILKKNKQQNENKTPYRTAPHRTMKKKKHARAHTQLTGPGQLGEGADDSFALAYTSLTLHHIQECNRTVSTLAGYLRPGGRLLVFDIEATDDAQMFPPTDFEVRG